MFCYVRWMLFPLSFSIASHDGLERDGRALTPQRVKQAVELGGAQAVHHKHLAAERGRFVRTVGRDILRTAAQRAERP